MYVNGTAIIATGSGAHSGLQCRTATATCSPIVVIVKFVRFDRGNSRNVRQLGLIRNVTQQFKKYDPTMAKANATVCATRYGKTMCNNTYRP